MMINKYTVREWAELDGMELNEIEELYGADVVAFFAEEDGEMAGVEHADGTYSVIGCMVEENGLSYEEMLLMLA